VSFVSLGLARLHPLFLGTCFKTSTFFKAGFHPNTAAPIQTMRYFSVLFALAAPLLASAAPTRFLGKRAAVDILVLQFADVLEQLESTFYQQALAKFKDSDFTAAGFSSSQIPIEQFTSIQADEATHSSTLQSALKAAGAQPISGCNFNFDSVLTDVATMAAAARVIEMVGVAAYLGGAAQLTDPVLLAAAASILTIEARHQTVLNILSGSGTAIPAAFDIAFTPNEVLAIAGPFISGCSVGVTANTPLSITNNGSVTTGTTLTFSAASINGTSQDNLFCQMLIGDASIAIPLPLSQCVVPSGINGPVALFITSDGQPLLNDVHDRAEKEIIAGPTLAFIDAQPQTLPQLVKAGNGSQPLTSTTTQTISPAQASGIISSASGVSMSTSASDTTPSATPAGVSPTETPSTSASIVSTPGGMNTFTGPSPDGMVTVNGWSEP